LSGNHIVIVTVIVTTTTTYPFMQGLYNYIPKTMFVGSVMLQLFCGHKLRYHGGGGGGGGGGGCCCCCCCCCYCCFVAITFMQSVYNYIPASNHVSRVYTVASVMY